ncbi:Uncharacterized protein DAT39_005369 [Clarias magur]|uniref:Uncharacterized protein n=1 Tax=Clarias magur TaxID=1594786 RepID=A0A8J4X7T6_CLAMG|nr:Uncharacterized protein DAT39_005369 [Clarias magur]
MKIFLLSFLTFMVVNAAHDAYESKLQKLVLREIIDSIKVMKDSLATEIYVQKVITTDHCTPKNFCRAGNILSAYKAQELGLKEKDWLLPRQLVAYTRDIYCKVPTSEDQLENFCQAKMVLSAYRAKELGLRKKDWRIPRHLAAYTREERHIKNLTYTVAPTEP